MRVSSRRRLARLLRATGAGALTSAFVLAVIGSAAPPASAETKVTASGGYYWASQPDPLPAPLGQPAGNLPNPLVPPGDLAVASVNGESNMESYLVMDLSALPTPGTASNFVLHLAEDAGSEAATAVINAAPVADYFGGDYVAARPYRERPALDENGPKTAGQRSTTGEWTWDVTSIVTACLTAEQTSCGVALLPGGGNFLANFVGPGAPEDPTGTRHAPYAVGDATATASTDTDTDTSTDTGGDTVAGPVTEDTGSGSSGADFGGSSGSVIDTPTAPNPINTPVPPPAQPAVVRPDVKTTSAGGVPDHSLPFAFFLAALGMIALLGSFMFALGEAGEPALARTGSVFRTIDERLAAAAGGAAKE